MVFHGRFMLCHGQNFRNCHGHFLFFTGSFLALCYGQLVNFQSRALFQIHGNFFEKCHGQTENFHGKKNTVTARAQKMYQGTFESELKNVLHLPKNARSNFFTRTIQRMINFWYKNTKSARESCPFFFGGGCGVNKYSAFLIGRITI